MPILFDAVTNSSNDTTPNAVISWSHTVAVQPNRILLVGVANEEPNAAAGDLVVTGITYNGVALTKLDSAQDADGSTTNRTELWYLLAPATGANTVEVTQTGDVDGVGVSAISYYNVRQVAPTFASAHASASSAVSTSITPPAINSMLVDVAVNGSAANTLTVGGGQTERVNQTSSPDSVLDWGMSEKLATSVASTTMTWTLGGNSRWGQVVAALYPIPTSGFFGMM